MHEFSDYFKKITPVVPASLEKKVLLGLHAVILEEARARHQWAIVGLMLSLSGVAGVVWFLGEFLVQSTFWSLLMLLFSDPSTVANAFQDFGYSLLETLPLLPLILFLIPLTLLFWSLSILFATPSKHFSSSLSFTH